MGNTGARRRWWLRGVLTANPGGGSHSDSALDDARTARRRDRLAKAETALAGWVAAQSTYDPDDRASFDPRVDALKSHWCEEDDRGHDNYLTELGERLADSKAAVETAERRHKQAQENKQRAWQDYREARRRLGGELLPLAVTPNDSGLLGPPPGGVVPLRAIEAGPNGWPFNANAAGTEDVR